MDDKDPLNHQDEHGVDILSRMLQNRNLEAHESVQLQDFDFNGSAEMNYTLIQHFYYAWNET